MAAYRVVEGFVAPVYCTRCGTPAPPGARFCGNCGNPFVGPPAASVAPPVAPYPVTPPYRPVSPYPGPPAFAHRVPRWEVSRQAQVRRTLIGVLLLLVGTVISWIPVIGVVGLLVSFVGAITVLSGRKAFGPNHRRNLVISIVLLGIGIGASLIGAIAIVLFALASIPSGSTQAQVAAVLQTTFTNLLILGVATAVITSLSFVLFTYDLQKREGRLLLWAGYGATLGLQTAVVVLTLPLIPGLAAEIAREIATMGRFDATLISATISGDASGLTPFGVIPAGLYALANYLAFTRIKKGEIPPPAAAPAGPSAPPNVSPPASPFQPP